MNKHLLFFGMRPSGYATTIQALKFHKRCCSCIEDQEQSLHVGKQIPSGNGEKNHALPKVAPTLPGHTF